MTNPGEPLPWSTVIVKRNPSKTARLLEEEVSEQQLPGEDECWRRLAEIPPSFELVDGKPRFRGEKLNPTAPASGLAVQYAIQGGKQKCPLCAEESNNELTFPTSKRNVGQLVELMPGDLSAVSKEKMRDECHEHSHAPLFCALKPREIKNKMTTYGWVQQWLHKTWEQDPIPVDMFQRCHNSDGVPLKLHVVKLLSRATGILQMTAFQRQSLKYINDYNKLLTSVSKTQPDVINNFIDQCIAVVKYVTMSIEEFDFRLLWECGMSTHHAWNLTNAFFTDGLFFDPPFPALTLTKFHDHLPNVQIDDLINHDLLSPADQKKTKGKRKL